MPDPLIILSAPRTFSSVSGSMLGQHPEAYGFPELNLFGGDTLGEAWNGMSMFFPRAHDGLLRSLAQLHDGEQTVETVAKARSWVLRRFHWTVPRVFDYLQDLIGDKMIVEKGPSLTFNPGFLERAHRFFPTANFLHLVRHPRGTAKSLIELRDNVTKGKIDAPKTIVDPEQLWLKCHTNASKFGATLPAGQYIRVKGEDLMRDPHLYLPQVAQWLGIDDGEDAINAMLAPETSSYACLGPETAPYGLDPNFLQNPKLDWDRLANISEASMDGELSWRPGENFSQPVRKLAHQFGYQ